MIISIKEIIEYNIEDFKLMESWENDSEIKCYITPRRSEEQIGFTSAEELMLNAMESINKYKYFILADDKPVGVMSIMRDFPFLETKEKNVAWISIYIGDKSYWGHGISKSAMTLLENECKAKGFEIIELGVFGFNLRAQRLYEKMSYKKIGQIERFVFYEGEFHKDIRMSKHL